MLRHAVIGGNFSPPVLGHFRLIENVANSGLFDVVHVIPAGHRIDKPDYTPPNHKEKLIDIMVRHLVMPDSVKLVVHKIDLFGQNTPTIIWLETLKAKNPDDWFAFVVGSDLIKPAKNGYCEIENSWVRGRELVSKWQFVAFPRPGYRLPDTKYVVGRALYKRFRNLIVLMQDMPNTSSTALRNNVAAGKSFEEMTHEEIAQYIKHNRLLGWGEK